MIEFIFLFAFSIGIVSFYSANWRYMSPVHWLSAVSGVLNALSLNIVF